MRIRKSVRVILISFILFAILDCAFLFMLPVFLTASVQEYMIKQLVSLKTTATIDLSMRPIKTFSDFSIQGGANYINLKDKNDEIIFSGQDIDIKASVLPLIFKRISVNNFNTKKLFLNIERDKDGQYNIAKIFKKQKNKFDYSLSKFNCNIENYEIGFIDELNEKTVFLKGDYFRVNRFISKKFVDLDTSGVIITAGENQTPFNIKFASELPLSLNPDLSKTIIEGYFENFSLGYFEPYLKEYVADDIQSASSDMSFEFHTNKNNENDNKKQFSITGSIDNLLFDKTSLRGKMSSEHRIETNISLEYEDLKLTFDRATIKSDNFEAHANGEIQFYKDAKPYLDLSITVPKSSVEDIAKFLPTNIIPKDSDHKDILVKTKKYDVFGNIKGSMLIKGQIPKPQIKGYVLADNVHLFNRNDNTHKGIIDLKFQGNTMVMDIDVRLAGGEGAKIGGMTYLFNEGTNHFSIKSTENLNLPLAQKIVLPVQDVLGFELGPIPMMTIKNGFGSLDLKIDGTKYEGSVFGETLFRDGIVGYNGLFGEVMDAQGAVLFNDKEITYDTNGYLAGYKLNVNGKAIQNGNIEINVGTDAIETAEVMPVIEKSPMLFEIKQGLSALTDINGKAKIDFSLRGDIQDFQSGNNIRARGTVYLFNDTCKLIGFNTPLHSIKGIVEFSDKEVYFKDLRAMVENSPVNAEGNILINKETKIPTIDITVTSDSVNAGDTIRFLAESDMSRHNALPDISNLYALDSKHDLLFKYNAQNSVFDVKKAYAVMNFLERQDTLSPIKFSSGKIVLSNAKTDIDNVIADFFNTKATISGNVNRVDTPHPVYNLNIDAKGFNFETMPQIQNLPVISENAKKTIGMFDDFKGYADFDLKIKDNNMSGSVDVSQLTFRSKKTNIPVFIPKTKFDIKGNKLSTKALSAKVGQTDIFGDIALSELGRNNLVNAHLNTKITNDFVEAYVNPSLPQKVLVIGDIDLYSEIKGSLNDLKITPKITFNPDSDMFYMDTNLGNIAFKRELGGLITLTPHNLRLSDFKYERAKQKLVTFSADIDREKNIINSLSVVTHENLPVKFLNPVFNSEIFKSGDFSANLKYYTDSEVQYPKLSGSAEFRDTVFKIINFETDKFKLKTDKDLIKINLSGEAYSSDLEVAATVKNNLSLPINIDSLKVSSSSLDNTTIIDSLNSVSEEYLKNVSKQKEQQTDRKNILNINNGEINIDKLNYQNLFFKNISAKYTLDDKDVLQIKDIKADISEGTIEADASYSIPTGDIKLNVSLSDVDSNAIAENIFGAKNQLYGTGHGRLIIETKGTTTEDRIKNLNGECYFVIIDGKMPKLGSLESLLRASNIVKSGISGLTINSMLDLLNFAKTGSFRSINGSFIMDRGIVKDISLFSQGTNLSIYMNGKYNIAKGTANAEIWGKLSNKLSTLLGPIGNASINSFFSLIPGINISEGDIKTFNDNIGKIPPLDYSNDDFRIFQAIIDGNINSNSSEYVKSFKWVE
ncbi:hypothetical protein IKQ26_03740 [bacterium]|nr:hypothetical protein [bacterium]